MREQSRRSLDLTVADDDDVVAHEKKHEVKHDILPPKKILNNSNLKKLKSYRNLRKNIKSQNEESEFISQLTDVLNLFDENKVHYDPDVLVLIMQIAENWFLGKKDGEKRKRNVIIVAKRFFDENEELVNKMIEIVLPTIKQNKYIERNFLKKIVKFSKGFLVSCLRS